MTLADILAWDADISARLRIADKPGGVRTAAAVLAHSGDSWFWVGGLILLWRFGLPPWNKIAAELNIGVLVTAALVMLIKFSVRRRRPAGEWGGIYRHTDPHSFPSGHAARVVMLTVMSIGLVNSGWWSLLLCLWAPLVGLARVAMGVHYFSDVIAGMVLGGVIGGIILALL